MNGAQIHLLINHGSVIGLPIGLLVLAVALLRKNADVRAVGLAILAIVGLASLPAYFSGEPAEGVVEHLPGISERLIHPHEEAAEWGLILCLVTAAGAIGSLVFRRGPASRLLPTATLLLGLIAFAAIARTAHLGGLIHHEELRGGVAAPAEGGGGGGDHD